MLTDKLPVDGGAYESFQDSPFDKTGTSKSELRPVDLCRYIVGSGTRIGTCIAGLFGERLCPPTICGRPDTR